MSEDRAPYNTEQTAPEGQEHDAARLDRARRLWVRRMASQALDQADGDRAIAELVLTEALLLLKQGFKP